MAEGIVYLITRRADGSRYVGITAKTLADRWAGHVAQAKRGGGPMAAAIRQDGADGFDCCQLEIAPLADLPAREKEWISRLGTLIPDGLNANRGGSGTIKTASKLYARAARLSEATGACKNTARRWVREGRAPAFARTYVLHGATNTPHWRRWHDKKTKGGLCLEWGDFARYLSDVAELVKPGYRLCRIDKAQPWGPSNVELRPYGRLKSLTSI